MHIYTTYYLKVTISLFYSETRTLKNRTPNAFLLVTGKRYLDTNIRACVALRISKSISTSF